MTEPASIVAKPAQARPGHRTGRLRLVALTKYPKPRMKKVVSTKAWITPWSVMDP